ncbi:MAG: T9SS type A sorting domain-containing protein [Flavobacteriales bacterium]
MSSEEAAAFEAAAIAFFASNNLVPVGATDNCDAAPSVNEIDLIVEGAGFDCPTLGRITCVFQAQDLCGNLSATANTYINIIDNTAPVFTFVPGSASFSCEQGLNIAEAIAEDACSEVSVTFVDEFNYECENTYNVIRTWTATDACGNSATASAMFFVYDNVAPVMSGIPSDVYVACLGDVPAPAAVSAQDNCGSASVDVETSIIYQDDCGNQTIQVSYTASDACGNSSSAGYTIFVNDVIEPTFINCPTDLVIDCADEVPAAEEVIAIDNCDQNLEIVFEEYIIGTVPAEGVASECDLITPLRPAGNPCGYAYDWAMAIFGLPTSHKYYTVSNGSLQTMEDGTLQLSAELHNAQNPANGWNLNVSFSAGMDWNSWSSQAFPTSFKADCGGEAVNHEEWMYYVLQAGSGAELSGFGAYAGSSLNMAHAPANQYFGFQMGNGANNYNGADNGFGGWFTYNGYFQVNNTPYGTNGGNIQGAGDIALELECCPDYYVVRQWTAMDCSGNSSSCTQTITFDHLNDGNGAGQQTLNNDGQKESSIAVNAMPNPADEKTIFSFVAAQDGLVSIEIFDIAGAKVGDYNFGHATANTQVQINFPLDQLATGVYVYRVKNGSIIDQGKLIVEKK